MAIAVFIDCRGVTLEQYDEAIERGGFLPGEPLPPEGLFHWVTKTDHGILVVNVWESREGYGNSRAGLLPSCKKSVSWSHPKFASSRCTTTSLEVEGTTDRPGACHLPRR